MREDESTRGAERQGGDDPVQPRAERSVEEESNQPSGRPAPLACPSQNQRVDLCTRMLAAHLFSRLSRWLPM